MALKIAQGRIKDANKDESQNELFHNETLAKNKKINHARFYFQLRIAKLAATQPVLRNLRRKDDICLGTKRRVRPNTQHIPIM